MPKYRKKPVVIEAFQMTKERRSDNSEWPQWLHEAWNKDFDEEGALFPEWKSNGFDPLAIPKRTGTDPLKIKTLEGVMSVDWDDWIIRGVNGEIYPCKPDIFEKTYEPA